MKSKAYTEANAESFMGIPEIFQKILDITKDNPVLFFGLQACHKDAFLRDWGRQDFCWFSGYVRYYIWVKEFKHCRIFVLTHRVKGTCYEVSITGDRKLAIDEIWKFILEMNATYGRPILERIEAEIGEKK